MKTMTCSDLGGPCNAEIHGETADEMLKNAKEHVHSVDDEGHKKVIVMMQEMQDNPEEGKKWNEDFAKIFEELPQD